jgi:hypothetical protein
MEFERTSTRAIDQTLSEVQLHRVLYVLKFLRAMVLHVLLALSAVLLFFLAGINNVYPLANDLIRSLRAQLRQSQLQGHAPNPAIFGTSAAVAFAAARYGAGSRGAAAAGFYSRSRRPRLEAVKRDRRTRGLAEGRSAGVVSGQEVLTCDSREG